MKKRSLIPVIYWRSSVWINFGNTVPTNRLPAYPLTIQIQSAKITVTSKRLLCGHGSAGRMSPCQGEGHGFESRCPLRNKIAATWPSWQGKGLQNPHHEFESRRRLLERTSIHQKRQNMAFFHSQASEAGCWLRSAMMVSSKPMIWGNCTGVMFPR